MNILFLIDYPDFNLSDILQLNQKNKLEIKFDKTTSSGFLPPEILTILICFIEQLPYNLAYDCIINGLIKIFKTLKSKNHQPKSIKILCNNKSYSLEWDSNLSEKQLDLLIDSLAKRMLSD